MLRKLSLAVTTTALLVGGAAAPATAATAPASAASVRADIPDQVDVTSSNFKEVMEWSKTKPVVLDFTAEWCEWCQKQKPYLEEYNKKDKGSWVWARVDVDANPDISKKYKVEGIPALLNMQKGEEAGSRNVGFDGPEQLRTWLDSL